MRLVTDTETLKAHIIAELHAAEWATPVERRQVDKVADAIIERLQRPEKISDITGFLEDDEDFDGSTDDHLDAGPVVTTPLGTSYRRRIPGMPKDL